MNDTSDPQVVRSYLEQLQTALADVPADVRRDIVAGVAEELRGLDAAAAASRIESLGDPAFIAAEASAEVPVTATPTTNSVVAPRLGSSSQRWYVVVTALLIDFGTFVLPLAGWVVGIMMMWSSPLWSRREKLYVTLAPIAAGLVVALISAIIIAASEGTFSPASHAAVLFGLVGAIAVAIGSGIYLSRRGWERTA